MEKPTRKGTRENIGRFLEIFLNQGYLYYINISDRIIPFFPSRDYYIFLKQNLKLIKKQYANQSLMELK